MNKGQLIDAVAEELGESKAGAARAVEAVFACIARAVQHDGGVTIAGFGTFLRKERKARMGRLPITGEPVEIKASRTVGFRPSQALRQTV